MNTTQNAAPEDTSLQRYIEALVDCWSRTSDPEEKAAEVCKIMQRFLLEAPSSAWMARMWRDQVRAQELYRDPEHGFVQIAHYHAPAHRNTPHDHGPHWVVYGVARGQIEIASYRPTADGETVRVADRKTLTPGSAFVYPVGAIHSTRQMAPEGSIVLRFLSQDLSGVPRQRYGWDDIVGLDGADDLR